MSREAWGDEGSVAAHWENTLIRCGLDEVINRFNQWNRDNGSEMPSPQFVEITRHIHELFTDLQDEISGKIDA